ncbi:MAG: TatD family hydrolase, partial [Prevotella sp.]|nr:TatD family hydrolase [Prevotella sp.]
MIRIIDTHTHLDGEEFADDRQEVIERAQQAGVCKVFIPAIDLPSVTTVMQVCSANPGYAYPMIGLHPEEVRADWQQVLEEMKQLLLANLQSATQPHAIAIGEVGLDYYWSREFEKEQLAAFEQQVQWSIETRLPLMIH